MYLVSCKLYSRWRVGINDVVVDVWEELSGVGGGSSELVSNSGSDCFWNWSEKIFQLNDCENYLLFLLTTYWGWGRSVLTTLTLTLRMTKIIMVETVRMTAPSSPMVTRDLVRIMVGSAYSSSSGSPLSQSMFWRRGTPLLVLQWPSLLSVDICVWNEICDLPSLWTRPMLTMERHLLSSISCDPTSCTGPLTARPCIRISVLQFWHQCT